MFIIVCGVAVITAGGPFDSPLHVPEERVRVLAKDHLYSSIFGFSSIPEKRLDNLKGLGGRESVLQGVVEHVLGSMKNLSTGVSRRARVTMDGVQQRCNQMLPRGMNRLARNGKREKD